MNYFIPYQMCHLIKGISLPRTLSWNLDSRSQGAHQRSRGALGQVEKSHLPVRVKGLYSAESDRLFPFSLLVIIFFIVPFYEVNCSFTMPVVSSKLWWTKKKVSSLVYSEILKIGIRYYFKNELTHAHCRKLESTEMDE